MTAKQTSLQELSDAGLFPAIVHMDNRGDPLGHFTVLVAVGENKHTSQRVVTLLDPVSTNYHEMPVGDFERAWSSYALVRERIDYLRYVYCGCLALTALALLGWPAIRRRFGSSSGVNRTGVSDSP